MKCPWCGNDVARREGETDEEFRERWESQNCDDRCEAAMHRHHQQRRSA